MACRRNGRRKQANFGCGKGLEKIIRGKMAGGGGRLTAGKRRRDRNLTACIYDARGESSQLDEAGGQHSRTRNTGTKAKNSMRKARPGSTAT